MSNVSDAMVSDVARVMRDAAIEAGWTPVDPVYAWACLVYERDGQIVEAGIWSHGRVSAGRLHAGGWKFVPATPRTPAEWRDLAETTLAFYAGKPYTWKPYKGRL